METLNLPEGFPVTFPHEKHFDHARIGRVFNHRRPSRQPIAVVHARNATDVQTTVRAAARLGVKVSIRSGGHSWAAWSVRDNAILLDLGGMNSIHHWDGKSGVIRVGPACTGEKLNGFLMERGRLFNGGHCPTVGVGGFLLQGGMGWNCRGWGWAAQSIVAMDVVTADGELRHCNAKENSEIFWSARGSGPGFFGVVTQFHIQSRPLPKALLASTYVYDAANEYDVVMPWVIETSRKAEPMIEIVAVALYADNTEDAPKDQRLQLVVHVLTFTDTEEDARRYLKIFADTVPRKEVAKVIEYEKTTIAQEIIEQYKQNPTEHRYCCDNAWINNLSAEEVSRAMRPVMVEIPSPQTFSLYFNMAPELPLQDMALSLQTEHYLAVYCIWKHAKDDEKCMGWMKKRFEPMGKVSPGVYLGDSDFQIRPQPFLAEGRREKLEGYRKKYDPEGRFCAYLGM